MPTKYLAGIVMPTKSLAGIKIKNNACKIFNKKYNF